MVKALFTKAWNSPTIMTWMSYSTKALSLFIVLPLILKQFSAEEISLWYLFSSIITLTSLADLGFKATFSRIIAFAMGGAKDVAVFKGDTVVNDAKPNWKLIEKICSNMNMIYIFLTLLLIVIFFTFGSWSLLKPISLVQDTQEAWIAWWVIIFTSAIKFYGTIYSNYLEGLNKIALIRRIESFMSLGAILTTIAVLLLGGTILQLVIALQIWVVLNVIRNWYLARIVEEGRYKLFKAQVFDKVLFMKIWKPAWRAGISGLMSNGLTHITGILYAQVGAVDLVAAYLLALKLITQIREISMAPFYSKIPLLTRLRVEGNLELLKQKAQKGMFLGHMVFVIGVILISLFSEDLLNAINSNVDFVSNEFWLLLSVAFFIHRYGAMHMQLYLTTNHVISHISDGVSGLIFIVTVFLTINIFDIYAIPIAMIIAYLGFYSWYAAYYSYKSLCLSFFKFEMKTTIVPLTIFILFTILNFFYNK
jgi:O-antigen/teichoic acid export membrane protein